MWTRRRSAFTWPGATYDYNNIQDKTSNYMSRWRGKGFSEHTVISSMAAEHTQNWKYAFLPHNQSLTIHRSQEYKCSTLTRRVQKKEEDSYGSYSLETLLKTTLKKRDKLLLCWWFHAEPFLRFRRGGLKSLIRKLRAGGLIFSKSRLYKPYINTMQVCSSPAGLWASHPASFCSLFFKNSGGIVGMTGSYLRCRFNLLASFSGWCGWMEGPSGPVYHLSVEVYLHTQEASAQLNTTHSRLSWFNSLCRCQIL